MRVSGSNSKQSAFRATRFYFHCKLWGGSSSDGRHLLGRDGNGCMYYQGSNLVGGATTYAPPGC
jgi:hypothetical protein